LSVLADPDLSRRPTAPELSGNARRPGLQPGSHRERGEGEVAMKSIKTKVETARTEEPLDSIRTLASGWDRFWFSPSDPTTVGLIRLLSGIVILYVYFCYSFDLLSYVSPREGWLDE